MIGNDLGEFVLDILRIDVLTAHRRQGLCRVLELPLLDKVSGAFGEEEETGSKNECPEELNGNGDAIGARVISVLSRVTHDIGEEDSEGDAEIVPGDQGSTYFLWGDLLYAIVSPWVVGHRKMRCASYRHIENHNCRDETHAKPSDQPARNHEA